MVTYDKSFSLNPTWNLSIVKAEKKPKIAVMGRLFLCINDKCTVKELLFDIEVSSDKNVSKKVKHKIVCTL